MGTETVRGGGAVPVPLWLPQVSPALTWNRTPASMFRGLRRTAFFLRCTYCTGNNVYSCTVVHADVQLHILPFTNDAVTLNTVL